MKNMKSLGIGPITDEKTLNLLKECIQKIEIPWNCENSIKDAAKEIAIYAVTNGLMPNEFIQKLVPTLFKNQRDAKHAMAKIMTIGQAAINYDNWISVGIKKYEWHWMPGLCDYTDHEKRNWKILKINAGEMPSTKYGCRCLGQAIFPL